MSITTQDPFLGEPAVSGNLRPKMAHILRKYPQARDDYRLATYYLCLELDGLGDALVEKADAFRMWFSDRASSPKTRRHQTMETQNRNPQLEASPKAKQQRQRLSTTWPVL